MSLEEYTRRIQGAHRGREQDPEAPPMDLQSCSRRYDNLQARDAMLDATDTDFASWYVVPPDGRKRARINMIEHLLANIPHKKLPRDKIEFPKRLKSGDYREPDYWLKFIPAAYCGLRAHKSVVPTMDRLRFVVEKTISGGFALALSLLPVNK